MYGVVYMREAFLGECALYLQISDDEKKNLRNIIIILSYELLLQFSTRL